MRRHLLLLLCAPIFAVAWLAYAPGLSGGFLFDDFANLPSLGAWGKVDNLTAFWRYLSSGTADPLGRPIALLSFLLDASDWPAAALPFKRTNLLIHLSCGLLLVAFLRKLGTLVIGNGQANTLRIDLAAVLGTAFWLLHPLLVSTTLYVVQREAMLPALFTLLGLLAWLQGRDCFTRGKIGSGWAWLLLGLGGCTCLATLSKANGILLPVLVLVAEFVIGPAVQASPGTTTANTRRPYWTAMTLVTLLPAVGVMIYLGYEGCIGMSGNNAPGRPWTVTQRLMTEPRILLEYLRLLWFPRPFTPGLFNDQIRASTSLWTPATTAASIVAVNGMIAAALLLRRRVPALSLAVLFYFAGQSLESTTVPLELYFEHRNYLPALLMFWPLALWLSGLPLGPATQTAAKPIRPQSRSTTLFKAGLAVVLLVCLASMTYARASLWGNTHDQALLWAKLNPSSARAQANAAQAQMKAGRPDLAASSLVPALEAAPDELQLALNLVAARCMSGDLDPQTSQAAVYALRNTSDTGALLANWFERAIAQSQAPACPQLDLGLLETYIQAALENPRFMARPGRRQDLYYLQGRIALARHQPDTALADFNRALDQQVRASAAFQQAALLGSAGYPDQALAHLDHYAATGSREGPAPFGMPRIHAWLLGDQHYWDAELRRLRTTLRDDQRARSQTAR